MIGPDSNKNIGGIVQIDIIPLSNVVGLREKNLRCVLFLTEGYTPLTVYRTYKSDRIQPTVGTSGAGTSYTNEIRWLVPNDRYSLWQSILPYLNQYVLVIATFNNGGKKLYGTPDFPLKLSANSTPFTTPDSFNGVEITCSGTDICPGRFLTSMVVPPVNENIDYFKSLSMFTDIEEYYLSDTSQWVGVTPPNVAILDDTLRLEVTGNYSSARWCSLKRTFDASKSVSKIKINIHSHDIVNYDNGSGGDNSFALQIYLILSNNSEAVQIVPIADSGIVEFNVENGTKTILGYRLSLMRYKSDYTSYIRLSSLECVP